MRPAALPLPLALKNNITKRIPKWVRAANCHPIDSPLVCSSVDQLQLVTTARSRSTTATPAEPVSASCAPVIRIAVMDEAVAGAISIPVRSHMRRKPTILDLDNAVAAAIRIPLMPRKPLLQDLILDAIRADPAVLPEILAVRLGTTKKSVQTVAGMWRQRKMLPPKPSRAVQQTTRLDEALAAEEACGAFLADVADVLGLADPQGVDMADVLAAIKATSSALTASRAELRQVDAALAAEQACGNLIADLNDVLGICSPQGVDMAGVLAAVKMLTSALTASRAELRQVDAALGPAVGLRSARIVQLRTDSAQNAQLRSELHAAHAELRQAPHLTESDLESRIDLWQDAARLAVQAETLREQQQGTLLCGVVLSGEELRQLATLRDAEATALRVRACRGQT